MPSTKGLFDTMTITQPRLRLEADHGVSLPLKRLLTLPSGSLYGNDLHLKPSAAVLNDNDHYTLLALAVVRRCLCPRCAQLAVGHLHAEN